MRPARAHSSPSSDDDGATTARQANVARPIQRPLVVTPDGKLDRRSQAWLERQQSRRASAAPVADQPYLDGADSTVVLPGLYRDAPEDIDNIQIPIDTRDARALTPVPPTLAPRTQVNGQRLLTPLPSELDLDTLANTPTQMSSSVIIPGGTLTPLPRVAPTPVSLRMSLMKRVTITLLALAFLISSAQVAAQNPALAQAGWQALANAVAFTQQQQASAIRTTGVAAHVQAFTQGRRPDLYNSQEQFNQWWGAACSAAVLAEVLTAYGVPNITIGKMIDELGPDISPSGGLMTYEGFNKVAAKHGFRADIYVDRHLSYQQMQYITNTLGLPVIVNVRATSGYYHYLSGGHFLVMTGGDSNAIRLVDSSLYYIKSLPLGTFNWMFRQRTVVIVPVDYHYALP
jgi:predicted double-glycine peptidase